MIQHDEAWCGPERIPFRDFIVFFCDGRHHMFPRCLFAMVAFCHGSHRMSHVFPPWLPWHFSMPRPSKWKSEIAGVQHTNQLSAHRHMSSIRCVHICGSGSIGLVPFDATFPCPSSRSRLPHLMQKRWLLLFWDVHSACG